jgi:type I restriction enzyme R subunit
MLAQAMKMYINGLISNEEVIAELMKIANEMATAHLFSDNLGLSDEEMAFYDALTKPQVVRDFYDNETLVAMTQELADTLRKSRTIDWQKKETARADMRRMVKRLLRKYNYPPQEAESAINIVISQCEMWTDN